MTAQGLPLLYALYGFVGLLEWSLALSRTLFTIKGNKILVPLTVFVETFVALLVFKRFVECNDWVIALCYSLGSALGSLVPMLMIGEKERGHSGRAVENTKNRSPGRADLKEVSHAG